MTLVTVFLNSNTVQAQSITRGSILDSGNKRVAYFYLMDTKDYFYWGCPSEFIETNFSRNFYRLETDRNQMIVAIKAKSKNQQQTLTIALTRLITEKKLTEAESFRRIFNFYFQNQNVPNWEYLLLNDI